MSEALPSVSAQRAQRATLLAAEVAGRQWGVIGRGQLRRCGLSVGAVTRWLAAGKLHAIHRGVYALGHPSIPVEGRLVAALLHAGSGAVLSHRTAAWWWGLIDDPPAHVEVSTRRRARSLSEVVVHTRRQFESTRHRRFPVTTVPQALLDLAATASLNEVRNALARAEYLNLLNVRAVEAQLGPGRPGAAKLRKALSRHQPRLAYTRSRIERLVLGLCEAKGVQIPEVNVRLHGWTVDFLWRARGLVVEADGYGNHHTPAQLDRDRRMDLTLRSRGLTVNRYSRRQVEEDGEAVIADVVRTLEALRPRPTVPSA